MHSALQARTRASLYALICMLVSMPMLAHANIILNKELPNAALVGKSDLHYLLWRVYDVELYSSTAPFTFDAPFMLSITYHLAIKGSAIAERSVTEMQNIGMEDAATLAKWQREMTALFPDVDEGVVLHGVYQPNAPTKFYKNDTYLGTIDDADFGRWFFGIWLDEKTSEPAIRAELLGSNT